MLEVSELFSDHAVLQREMLIPVWGWTAPETPVRVEFGGGAAVACGLSGDDGRFLLRLPPQPAGGPHTLKVTAGSEEYLAGDIYIGEVWLAGGQSNMEMPLGGLERSIPDAETIAFAAPVRMLTVPRRARAGRTTRVGAKWTLPEEGWRDWSAVGAYFARRLAAELEVPVGIIASNWGGTIAEAWTSRETLAGNPDFAAALAAYEEKLSNPEYWRELEESGMADPEMQSLPIDEVMARRFQALYPEYPANAGLAKGWAARDCDDAGWPQMELPGAWQRHEDLVFSGVLWFRRTVEIPASWAGRPLRLEIGAVDKHDVTYFEGVEVGATGQRVETHHWNVPRSYPVPAELVRPGRAAVAVRAYSFLFSGGLIGPRDLMRIYPEGAEAEAISLAGTWRYQVELNLGDGNVYPASVMGVGNPNSYGMLFDNMIHPLLPYALRGAIWYQGESNAQKAKLYRRQMNDLIADWRRAFGLPELAFNQVLLAGFVVSEPGADWPLLREAQVCSACDSGTGFASAIDVGEPDDIHPLDKETVGERLALRALADSYGLAIEGEGPVFAGVKRLHSGEVRLAFHHACGLHAGGSLPSGFEVAGEDGKFRAAAVRIEGEYVILSAVEPMEIRQVRYAWKDYPEEANLYNGAGLPMTPFRTPVPGR